MAAQIVVTTNTNLLASSETLLLIGRAGRLLDDDVARLIPTQLGEGIYRQMVKKTDPGDSGKVATTWLSGSPGRLHVAVLPEHCSRHNSPSRAWAISGLAGNISVGSTSVVLCLDDPSHAPSSLLALARALPLYHAGPPQPDRELRVMLLARSGPLEIGERLLIAADAVRRAARDTDEPPATLGCDALVERARAVAAEHGVSCKVFRREGLHEEGLGGILAVGQAAEQSPALVILDHHPTGARRTAGWVGKGIVYDTGGLSLKQKTSMPGMKTDMAGAAAVLYAFGAAVKFGCDSRIIAALCIAENAVGPSAVRPDDVITMHSGRTVEINNTDAEGRLVLSDGLTWLAKNTSPDYLVDLATLTGAQAIATGKRHAALYCTDEALETSAVAAGKHSGDLVHPLPFAPELFRAEFRSPIADMRNSVKDRNNAQSSCAAQFMGNHLAAVGYDRPWLHVDIAAPAVSATGRGTGFGVGLLLALEGLI